MKTALAFCVAGLSFAAWLARPEKPRGETRAPPQMEAPTEARAETRTLPQTPTRTEGAVEPARALLAGDALRHRIDDQIPTHLQAEAAACYHGGRRDDERLDLDYHLRVSGGEVRVTDARVASSTLGDSALERCIVERVRAVHLADAELPDYDGDDTLYISVGGFKPYLR
jgi:hypothetical protein